MGEAFVLYQPRRLIDRSKYMPHQGLQERARRAAGGWARAATWGSSAPLSSAERASLVAAYGGGRRVQVIVDQLKSVRLTKREALRHMGVPTS